MDALIANAWIIYHSVVAAPYLVQPSIPILFFGDLEGYYRSPLRVITVGLNPSRVEFPDNDRFLRFRQAQHVYPSILAGAGYDDYLSALTAYFRTAPYWGWFKCFEPILKGTDCSFRDRCANTAIHTDICSPLATDPTWNCLSEAARQELEPAGCALWHQLVDTLDPDVLVISVAQRYLGQINFPPVDEWRVIYTVERTRPFQVKARRFRLPTGKTTQVVFGRAAQTPFGTVSDADKFGIGAAIREQAAGTQR